MLVPGTESVRVPGSEGVWSSRALRSAVLNFRLVFLSETSEVGVEAASGAPSPLELALIFHCGFPLSKTFCDAHTTTDGLITTIRGSGAPNVLKK